MCVLLELSSWTLDEGTTTLAGLGGWEFIPTVNRSNKTAQPDKQVCGLTRDDLAIMTSHFKVTLHSARAIQEVDNLGF